MSVKKYLAITLLVVLMTIPLSKTIMLVHFYINQDYIAANLCQFKEIEENSCNGKCVLSEQLKQTEDTEKELPGVMREMYNLEWIFGGHDFELPLPFCETAISTAFYLWKDYSVDQEDFFHPPCV